MNQNTIPSSTWKDSHDTNIVLSTNINYFRRENVLFSNTIVNLSDKHGDSFNRQAVLNRGSQFSFIKEDKKKSKICSLQNSFSLNNLSCQRAPRTSNIVYALLWNISHSIASSLNQLMNENQYLGHLQEVRPGPFSSHTLSSTPSTDHFSLLNFEQLQSFSSKLEVSTLDVTQ